MNKCEDMDYSVDQIKDMFNWRYFYGFVGAICKACRKNCNVLVNPGWMCPYCGTYNVITDPIKLPLFTSPDFGPPQERIQEAYRLWENQNEHG